MCNRILILTFFLSVWVVGPCLLSGEDLVRMEPKHVAKTKYVTSAAVSPDGQYVAYTVSVPRRPLQDDNGSAWSELHVADTKGNSRPFITGKVSIGSPEWSADGSAVYYLAKRNDDDHSKLYRIPIDGGESVIAAELATSITGFDLAPDGKSVALLAKKETEKSLKSLREKGFDQEIYEEDWQATHVWIATINQDSAAPSSKAEPRTLELAGSASRATWSPSGKELMVILAPTPSVDDSYMHKKVHVVEAESGRIIRSIENPGKLGQVAWSPDGKHLAMVSGADIHDPKDGRLMVATVDGEEALKDILPGFNGHVTQFDWNDDASLYWLASEGVSSRFGLVNLDGGQTDLIEPGGETVFTHFARSDENGVLVLVGHSATHAPELFLFSDQSELPQRVTNVNPWLDEIRFAKQSVVRWKARDGLQLEGLLIHPLDYVEGRRYPTIMYVHGGPESHESNGWLTSYSRPGQVAAARGFAVFYPNYRGSTGRGVEFSKMGQEDAAGKEFDDLIDGIDHLIELGLADRDAIGVTGGSYGGYASAWCSTFYSERFAASVMFVGISDNVSKVGTTDIPDEMFLVHHRKHLWDDWEYFVERSPIRFVQRNQTPTLIMHGKEDPRVHPSQSLELFRHLKTLGKAPVRLVLFEGEGHGNRKAASRLDYNLRMLRWMQHFLQGPNGDPPNRQIDYHAALGVADED